MSELLDPKSPLMRGIDLGSSASVLAGRAEMAAEAEEQSKEQWEALPQHVKDKLVLGVQMRMARGVLMSSPTATPPRKSTVMRFINGIRNGQPANKAMYLVRNGMYLHPTKGWRGHVAQPVAA